MAGRGGEGCLVGWLVLPVPSSPELLLLVQSLLGIGCGERGSGEGRYFAHIA